MGDGYTSPQHCEHADESEYEHNEPDSDVTLCSLDMKDCELADVRRANRKLGEALREIYANNGEDESIRKICNEAFRWVDI